VKDKNKQKDRKTAHQNQPGKKHDGILKVKTNHLIHCQWGSLRTNPTYKIHPVTGMFVDSRGTPFPFPPHRNSWSETFHMGNIRMSSLCQPTTLSMSPSLESNNFVVLRRSPGGPGGPGRFVSVSVVSSPNGFITKDQFNPFLVFAKFVFRISEVWLGCWFGARREWAAWVELIDVRVVIENIYIYYIYHPQIIYLW